MTSDSPGWLLLILSLPSTSTTARMRIWRALKAIGCAALRDGAYILPFSDAAQLQLGALNAATLEEGGSGWLLRVASMSPDEEGAFHHLFDRTQEWDAFRAAVIKGRDGLSTMTVQEANRVVRKLTRDYDALHAIDFFPAEASVRAADVWQDFLGYHRTLGADEPKARAGDIALLERALFRGRTWATRRRPWVDRVASAWLIQRFIDPDARFLWLDSPADCPADALGFDFDGAAFTHAGARVTFETLLASFGLDADAGLARMGQLVHALDVGGMFVPEAAGFEAILDGARQRIGNDDELLADVSLTLNSLYAHYAKPNSTPEGEQQ